jgi:hypothetical protein
VANWKDDAFESDVGDNDRPAPMEALWNAFPDLADFFAGEFDEKGKMVRSPGSISIWIDQGRLKACFKLKAEARVGFVVFNVPEKGFHSLQEALAQGLIDWRKDGVRKAR